MPLMAPFFFHKPKIDAHEAAVAAALTTSLEQAFDAGDATSYTSGQTWENLVAGADDLFRGTDGTAEASDPTFNGTAGGLSSAEYFSFDGGDSFRNDAANDAYLQNIHKNSAAFTLAAVIMPGAVGSQSIAGTVGQVTSDTGFRWHLSANNNLQFEVANLGVAVESANIFHNTVVTEDAWHFLAVSGDEAAGSFIQMVDGVSETDSATYTSPATGDASNVFEVGARGGQTGQLSATSRIACFWAWSRALSATELNRLFAIMRDRFNI